MEEQSSSFLPLTRHSIISILQSIISQYEYKMLPNMRNSDEKKLKG